MNLKPSAARDPRWELPALTFVLWLVFISVPLTRGNLGLSWDAVNHHIYLGWSAEHPRFAMDYFAASYQSYQFPYLYWPAYKLAAMGVDGVTAGVVLATLHVVVVPPVWMMTRSCMPGKSHFDALMRVLAVVLGFMTAVVLKMFEATSNDLLAAAPLVWAMALSLDAFASDKPLAQARQAIVLAAFLAGVSVAFKLSNGPLAVLLPLLWILAPGTWRQRAAAMVAGAFAGAGGFLLVYGYWGWELWRHFGNPIYPFAYVFFESLGATLGWRP